jgi:hypothetical protein
MVKEKSGNILNFLICIAHVLTLHIHRRKNSFAIIPNFIKCNYREHIFVFVGHAIFSVSYLDDAIATSAEILFALNKNKTLDNINKFIFRIKRLLFICLH